MGYRPKSAAESSSSNEEATSAPKSFTNNGYDGMNDDTYSTGSVEDEKSRAKAQEAGLSALDVQKPAGPLDKVLGGIRGLWGTRLTENVQDDKDLYVRTTVRELILYLIFLINLCIMSLSMTSSTHFYYTNVLQSLFLDGSADSGVSFRGLQQMNDFWDFAEGPLMDGIYWETFYNGDKIPDDQTGYIFFENKLLGVPRIRQVKVRNDSCVVHRDFADDIKECYSNYDPSNEEKGYFGPDPTQVPLTKDAWNWTDIAESATRRSKIQSQIQYSGDGFYKDLSRKSEESKSILSELKKWLWIDRGTRVVMIDFTVYNANINLFCIIQLMAEFPATGGVMTSSQFKTVKLLHLKDNFDYFILGTEIVYMLYILYYTVEEIIEIKMLKMKYFRGSIWNIVDLIVIICSYIAAGFQIYRYITISDKLDALTADPNIFPEFGQLAEWQRIYNFMLAFIVFFAWLKLFKYISFNTTMNQLSETLSRSAKDLGGFFIMFAIVFLAYTQLGFLIFGSQVKDFSQFEKCIYTLFRIILGDFNFHQLEDAHRILGPIFFITYVFFVFFVLLNMFLAIINDTYSEVKADLSTQESEFDLGAFLKKGYTNMLTKMNLKKDRLKDIQDALGADGNGDGVVDWEEWRKDLKMRGVPDSEIEAVFAKYDSDGDMMLNAEEQQKLKEDLLKQAEQINKDIEDVKDRQEHGETLGLGLAPGPEGEVSPMSNDLLLEKLNKMFVTSDEFSVLGKRVERMEAAVANVVRKIDSIVTKIDQLDKHKARQDSARDKLFGEIGEPGPRSRKK